MIKEIRDKLRISSKGSIILEAAIIMPVFILAFALLIQVIPVFAQWENSIYIMAEEMRAESIKAAVRGPGNTLPLICTGRVYTSNSFVDTFIITRYGKHGDNDTMHLHYYESFKNKSFLPTVGKIAFKGKIKARAFIGRKYEGQARGEDEFKTRGNANSVYIFPEAGEKYHRSGCRFLKSNGREVTLTDSIKRRYKPCTHCNAKNLALGSRVVIFEKTGDGYHAPSCPVVDKFYIRVDKKQAEKRGYKPCKECY